MGFVAIWDKAIKAKMEHPKTKNMDPWTPIQLIEKPAAAGPKTELICQTELLQVAALGYTFLGTIKAKRENIVGPRKARTKPPKNTKK